MLPDIIKTEYEVEILSDNSNVYVPGDFYPSSDFIENFLAQYGPDDVEAIVVKNHDIPGAVVYICRLWEIKAFLHTYTTTKKTQSVDDL